MWAWVCDLVRENLETPGIWSVNSDPSLTNGVVLGKYISLSELLAMSLCVMLLRVYLPQCVVLSDHVSCQPVANLSIRMVILLYYHLDFGKSSTMDHLEDG